MSSNGEIWRTDGCPPQEPRSEHREWEHVCRRIHQGPKPHSRTCGERPRFRTSGDEARKRSANYAKKHYGMDVVKAGTRVVNMKVEGNNKDQK